MSNSEKAQTASNTVEDDDEPDDWRVLFPLVDDSSD